jgi:hypothetical protein
MNVFDDVNASVEALFSIHNIALWLATGLLAWCVCIILINGKRHFRPLARRLDERLAATADIAAAATDRDAQDVFADRFEAIDAAMMGGGMKAAGLRHAWSQFRGGLLDPEERPLRATTSPADLFGGIGRETRVLAWWANIFVAIGLSFTFLGIVAALLKAVRAMGSSADPATMQVALVGLLRITAAKFWTSIGGVLSSIVLRVFDRRWSAAIHGRLDRLCSRLERGTVFTTPQQLAFAQLRLSQAASPGGSAKAEEIVGVVAALAARIQARDDDRSVGGDEALAAAAHELRDAAHRIEAAATAAGASQTAASHAVDSSAATLSDATGEIGAILATLGHLAPQMAALAAPLKDGAERLAHSALAVETAVASLDRRSSSADERNANLAVSLQQASTAAARAFESYRERFDAVDVVLAQALDSIGSASAVHAAALTSQVEQIDTALGGAVDRLAGALSGIGDLAAALDDMRGEMRKVR